jgi:hypothetical protein
MATQSDLVPLRRFLQDLAASGGQATRKEMAVSDAIGYAMHRSRSHHAVIRVYDDAGNLIETYEEAGEFKEW